MESWAPVIAAVAALVTSVATLITVLRTKRVVTEVHQAVVGAIDSPSPAQKAQET